MENFKRNNKIICEKYNLKIISCIEKYLKDHNKTKISISELKTILLRLLEDNNTINEKDYLNFPHKQLELF